MAGQVRLREGKRMAGERGGLESEWLARKRGPCEGEGCARESGVEQLGKEVRDDKRESG